jgi:hypothetical protein
MRIRSRDPRVCSLAVLVGCLAAAACVAPNTRLGMPAGATPEQMREAERLGDLALDYWIARDSRLQRVAQRLRIAGEPLCKTEVNPILGLAVLRRSEFSEPHREAAERRFPDDRLYVTAVFDGMPAARAGVRPGDVLLTVDGTSVWKETQAYKTGTASAGAVILELERAGKPLSLEVERVLGCAYSAGLIADERINAIAGAHLGVTAYYNALVRELESDSQLPLVVGHELAHNMIRRLGIARPKDSVDHEVRADYIGAYLAARAGFPMEMEDARLFDILNRGDVSSLGEGGITHPLNSARVLAFKQALGEIRGKQAHGTDLMPEIR